MRNLLLSILLVFQGAFLLAQEPTSTQVSQEDTQIGYHRGITVGYAYGLSGDQFYQNPSSITQYIKNLGYNDIVTDDLITAGELWQHYVTTHQFHIEYKFPISLTNTGVIIGGLFRREYAERYAEVFYNPPYTFSGIDMSAYGGGLYAGLSYGKDFRKIGGFAQVSLGYFNFSREYLYYFYLDPQQAGFPINSSFHEKVYASGPGALIKAGVSYKYKRLVFAPIMSMILMKDELNFGGISAGVQLSYIFN